MLVGPFFVFMTGLCSLISVALCFWHGRGEIQIGGREGHWGLKQPEHLSLGAEALEGKEEMGKGCLLSEIIASFVQVSDLALGRGVGLVPSPPAQLFATTAQGCWQGLRQGPRHEVLGLAGGREGLG